MSPALITEVPMSTESTDSFIHNSKANFSYTSTENLKQALAKASHDFRSDVVTVPNESIMQAILDASVNDDIYDTMGDPSVNSLQDQISALTGKQAGLWAISGTMGNQISLRTHLTQPPHSVLVDHRAHVHVWESGALPVFSQASVTSVHPSNGMYLTLEDVKAHIIPDGNIHHPPTRVVSLENTLSGTILPLSEAQRISSYVRSYPVPPGSPPIAMHLDGARIFDGVIGESSESDFHDKLKAYCACFDSISLCLAKGVGAPMGSVIVGSSAFVARAKWFRKMFGGGARQPGMMAAAASAALKYTLPRLRSVHQLTARAASQLEEVGYKFASPVQTNMIILDLEAVAIPAAAIVSRCKGRGVFVFPSGRLVFHHQTSLNGVQNLVTSLRELMEDKKRGIELESGDVNGGCS